MTAGFRKSLAARSAVREGALWSIPVAGGDPVNLPHFLTGIKGLLGAGKDGVVAFTESQIGLFQLDTGTFIAFKPVGSEDQADIARPRRPQEVNLKPGGERTAEPSESHDRKRIVYLRSE